MMNGDPSRLNSRALTEALSDFQDFLLSLQRYLQQQASDLFDAGNIAEARMMQSRADDVNTEESRVSMELAHLIATALQEDLNNLQDTDVKNVKKIIDKIGLKNTQLTSDENMLKWVLGLASGVITLLLSVGTGGLAGAAVALVSLLAPAPTEPAKLTGG